MLRLLQEKLPAIWTDELYSAEFRASPSKYRDFDHALKHVLKATAKLVSLTEEIDHTGNLLDFPIDDAKKYIADIVISAVRLALTNPNGEIDLEQAVVERIERKMGVRLDFQVKKRPIGAHGVYPPGWPRCPVCNDFALDGHITCGRATCAEGAQRRSVSQVPDEGEQRVQMDDQMRDQLGD